ncbi:hypothetical protein MAA5396_03990 [Marinovum algicola]|uniref:ChsH2 C-terminal OB-fold domain-containing protein n=1 Tax=Marinovum algicola TaxID=42444 RepID=A0A975WEV1_9RHOB|nr:OB-fold domain-containing protein [Marinovum algicola]SEK09006.1 hypothetical protein SAMN04487940_12818 [Marinovum algicola]SLN71816.1 hypothetical protein MAA5396_03990 [Marinovum algicola]
MTDTEKSRLGPQAAYEAFLAEGRFMIQRAASTGEYLFWPKVTSPSGATDLEWVEARGTGTIYAITVNRARKGARNVALVDLDEGVRMMSTLPDVETAEIGAPVKARIEMTANGPRVVFDLAKEASA